MEFWLNDDEKGVCVIDDDEQSKKDESTLPELKFYQLKSDFDAVKERKKSNEFNKTTQKTFFDKISNIKL